jgi:hypothetical protein
MFFHTLRLGRLIDDGGDPLPISHDQLRELNPFAVTYRYDDFEYELTSTDRLVELVTTIRTWSEEQVKLATSRDT